MAEPRTPIEVKRDLRNQVAALKEMLHHGARKELAKELNISDSYVRDVLAGRRWDLGVIEGLIGIAKKNMNRALKAESEIKKLVAQKKGIDSGK